MEDKTIKVEKNQDGFALITAMIMMVVLTFLGMAATNTAIMELNIAGNERQASQRFYTADSGWKQGGSFLNNTATPPPRVNQTKKPADTTIDWGSEYYQIVRNFGDGADTELNDDFSANSQDGTIATVPYWYRVLYQKNTKAIQFGKKYRDFQYGINCSAAGTVEVETQVKKVFRVGY